MRSPLVWTGLILLLSFGMVAAMAVQTDGGYIAQYNSTCLAAPQSGDCPGIWYQATLYSWLFVGSGAVALAGLILTIIGLVRGRNEARAGRAGPIAPAPGIAAAAPGAGPGGQPGADQPMACPRCGATVRWSDRYCGACGFQGRT